MIPRKIFKNVMSFIQERKSAENKLTEAFSEEFVDCDFFPYVRYETEVVKLLGNLMGDESDWISYFIYELDFGRNYKEGDVTERDVNGKEIIIPMGTVDDLYDVLIQNIARKSSSALVKEVSEIIKEEMPNFVIPRKKYYQQNEGVMEEELDACSLRIIEAIKGKSEVDEDSGN